MQKKTTYTFADETERDTYGPFGTGVSSSDTCSLISDNSEWIWDQASDEWVPSGGTVGQQTIVAPAGTPVVNIDFNDSPNARVDAGAITGASTFTLANPIAGGHYTVLVYNGPGVGLTWNWPANVKFVGGTAPIPDPTGIFSLYYDGTDYWAFATQVNLF